MPLISRKLKCGALREGVNVKREYETELIVFSHSAV